MLTDEKEQSRLEVQNLPGICGLHVLAVSGRLAPIVLRRIRVTMELPIFQWLKRNVHRDRYVAVLLTEQAAVPPDTGEVVTTDPNDYRAAHPEAPAAPLATPVSGEQRDRQQQGAYDKRCGQECDAMQSPD